MLAVQHAQHLPSLQQAKAAVRSASGTAALQKLMNRPVFPASPAVAAAVGQAAASIASLPGISTLQAGLESSKAFSPGDDSPAGSALVQVGGRAALQGKRHAAVVDAVYSQIQVRGRGACRYADGLEC